MTQTEALAALIKAIEAGDWRAGAIALSVFEDIEQVKWYVDAHSGSLDAANRLHDTLLPGWFWMQTPKMTISLDAPRQRLAAIFRVWGDTGDATAVNVVEARAWLIAILKAYRETLE